MSSHKVSHTSFVIERRFKHSPQRVFAAWSNSEAKKRWFACHDGMVNVGYSLDFRPGGSETNKVAFDGNVHAFSGHYLDIVPGERIIYAYDMHVDTTKLSASLATVTFEPDATGTLMVFTEQVAFLDGHNDREDRIRGTADGLDRLALELDGLLADAAD
jgi:uncharacterized protein YndB with AHSA1/START domain